MFMKILSTEGFDIYQYQQRNSYLPKLATKKRRKSDFREILEAEMKEPSGDPEGFRILLPTNGHFWDNGYEDKE